ncbi:MAG: RidA family protein [Desulfovibrionaceae bacterium]|nr:RidA family protein [Desulfovibrionaceae bacterium]
MDKKAITAAKAPAAIGPYSQGIMAGGFIFTSGQIPLDPASKKMSGDIREQARQALGNVRAILEEAGSGMDRVVKVTVFLADIGDFAVVNEVYAEFFKEPFPARSAFAVKDLPLGARVEIEAVALA